MSPIKTHCKTSAVFSDIFQMSKKTYGRPTGYIGAEQIWLQNSVVAWVDKFASINLLSLLNLSNFRWNYGSSAIILSWQLSRGSDHTFSSA